VHYRYSKVTHRYIRASSLTLILSNSPLSSSFPFSSAFPFLLLLSLSSPFALFLQGQKWAANLWVWNGPRDGYWIHNPATGKNERPKSGHNAVTATDEPGVMKSISASFESSDVIGAQLYWGDQFWDTLTQGRGVKVNTFPGHVWNVRMGEEVVVSWVVGAEKSIQRFVLSSEDLPTYA
jgi:hypothetical protein